MNRFTFVSLCMICAAACGGGSGGEDASRLYVVRQAYETNVIQWYFDVFEIEPITGQLEHLDLRVDHGDEKFFMGRRLVFHPERKYLVLGQTGSFRAMSFDDDGGFTLLPESETNHRGFYTGAGPVVPHPNGRLIYVFNPGTSDSPAGVFILAMGDAPPYFEMVGDVMGPGCDGKAALTDPEGTFLYCSGGRNEILTLAIDADTGRLSNVAKIPVEPSVRTLRYHSSGELLYALVGEPQRNRIGWRRSWIIGYRRNPVTGRLSPVVRGALRIDNTWIADIALTPDGDYLFATDRTLGHVKVYGIAETGQLTELSGARSGKGANDIVVDPSGRFVYVGNTGSKDLAAFTIGENGSLVPMTGSPIALGAEPIAMVID